MDADQRDEAGTADQWDSGRTPQHHTLNSSRSRNNGSMNPRPGSNRTTVTRRPQRRTMPNRLAHRAQDARGDGEARDGVQGVAQTSPEAGTPTNPRRQDAKATRTV